MQPENIIKNTSKINSTCFLIRIQFQQYNTWQGMIYWLDGQEKKPFKSYLEATMLISEAMEKLNKEREITNKAFNLWVDKQKKTEKILPSE